MRVVLAGQRAFAIAVLEMLEARGDQIAGVCTPDTGGLAERAAAAGYPVVKTAGVIGGEMIPPDVDVIVAAHCHDYISPWAMERARYGALGYHPSLLPRHRGRDAVKWAVKMGDGITGGTVYWMDDGVDTGDIVRQDWCWVRPGDTASDLWKRELFQMGVRLFREALADFDAGRVTRIPQDEALATWEPSLSGAPAMRRG